MANVKKQAKNTAKSKTDEQTTQSESQTLLRSYKRRIVIFLSLSLFFLSIAALDYYTNASALIAIICAFLAIPLALQIIFPSLKNTTNNESDTSLCSHPLEIKNGMITNVTGRPAILADRTPN